MTPKRFGQAVAACASTGLVVRLAWVAWASRQPAGIFVDPARYLGYGEQIAQGNGMTEALTGDPTAYYPPGYPWFVGIIDWLSSPFTDEAWVAVGVVQAVLGTVTVIFVALVARHLAGDRAGVLAAAVYALYPNLVFHTGVVLGETLYNFLFLGFLVLLFSRPWSVGFSYWRIGGCGLVLGLAVMVRPISLAVIPIVALGWLWARKDWGIALRWTGVLLAGVAACILPWTIRNAVRLDAFVPISTNTGDNLCIGHGEGATGAFGAVEACEVPYEFLDGLDSELRSDKEKTRIAISDAVANIDREPWLLWRRFYFTWVRDGDHDGVIAAQSYRQDRWIDTGHEAALIRVADVAYWLVAAAGLVGMVQLARRRQPEAFVFVGSAVMTALVPLAFFGDSRFKVPVIPLLIIAAATLWPDRGDHGDDQAVAEDGSGRPESAPTG